MSMEQQELIPHLFRTEYRKIVAVLCKTFGIAHLGAAEDIASDTFLQAAETWSIRGLPPNPVAWLYTVAKNKAKNHLRHEGLFQRKIAPMLRQGDPAADIDLIDLSPANIADSQLQMMFVVCHPCISVESQVSLALRILCGFGIEEIADAFLSNKETINKRLMRAKERLRAESVPIEVPGEAEIGERLGRVLVTLYLLFNEGYYSSSHDNPLRLDLCQEAMRLTHVLIGSPVTDRPAVNALLSLMSFQASRFAARTDAEGIAVVYDDQDEASWDRQLVGQGEYFLNRAAQGDRLSTYHLEAGIACWHTQKADSREKWEAILQLYNQLLVIEYSPVAALNRTYALSKANGKAEAIIEAEKLKLSGTLLYHSLLGELYTGVDDIRALGHFETAMGLARRSADKSSLARKIERLRRC
jgi:RNA polymerase sigma factor (sigma-70 family)